MHGLVALEIYGHPSALAHDPAAVCRSEIRDFTASLDLASWPIPDRYGDSGIAAPGIGPPGIRSIKTVTGGARNQPMLISPPAHGGRRPFDCSVKPEGALTTSSGLGREGAGEGEHRGPPESMIWVTHR